MFLNDFINELLYTVPAVLIAIVTHEWAHGFVSYKLGDPTPKLEGRLSLNPFKHLDLMGTLCLLLFHFGWAKPVMVNVQYYKDKKMGMTLTALAGPCMNLIVAFTALLLMSLLLKSNPYLILNNILFYIFKVLQYTAIMSVGLAVFNLIPIPPLDGSKALFSFLPADKYFGYMRYEQYGSILLVILLATGILSQILNPLSTGVYNGLLRIIEFLL